MSPDETGQLTPEELKAKGFKLEGGAPDDTGKTKGTPPDDTGGKPGKYDGKSEDELRKILTEQEKKLGEMSTRVDEFKGNVEYWRNKADQVERERQLYAQRVLERQEAPADKPPAQESKFNWEAPISSVDERINQRLTERDQKMAQMRAAEVQEEAKMSFQNGFKRAIRENPKLFEGETFQAEVADFMYNYYAPFAGKGVPVSRYVGDPDVWKKVAQNRRLEKEEFDYLQPGKISPVSPTQTNIPAGGRLTGSEDEPVNLEPGAKDMIDFFKTRGYVKGEEEAAELVRDERKDRVRREE